MLFPAAIRLRARFGVVLCVLVAVILVVPAAVRATQPVKAHASTLRLNRGFDLPVSKQSVPQPDMLAMFPSILAVEPPSAVAPRPAPERERTLPESADWPSPDPLRGPPVSSFA